MTEPENPGQYRLAQLQVYNWGTFDGLHRIDISRKGFLVTGPSGSGKSTLIDAVSAVLVPPVDTRFNAAAGGARRGGRSIITYCRGAWRRRHDEEFDELSSSFLRPGATWSGLLLRYDDGLGSKVSALRLIYLKASVMAPAEAVSLYVVLPRAADLTEFEDIARGGLDLRAAKRDFADATTVTRGHRSFSNDLRKRLGIADPAAVELLHRTQSAKSLDDLNALMRGFMLPTPSTFAIADQAVEMFNDLDTAYQAVDRARRQIETLSPIRDDGERLEALESDAAGTEAEIRHLEAFAAQRRQHIAGKNVDEAEAKIVEAQARRKSVRSDLEQIDHRAADLRGRIQTVEGDKLPAARAELRRAEEHRTHVADHRHQYEQLAAAVDVVVPNTPADFAEVVLQISAELERIAADREKNDGHEPRVFGEVDLARRRVEEVDRELAMVKRYRSTMDPHLLAARELIVAATNLHQSDLPFVADMLQIKEGEERWQRAAEAVLGGFARELVVPDEHYAAVSEAIDSNNLNTRLRYTRVTDSMLHRQPTKVSGDALALKLETKPGRYAGWIHAELAQRFDHRCVDELKDFRRAERAVTVNGQVKNSANRHVKDDRASSRDRSRWVLGPDTEQRLETLREAKQAAKKEYDRAQANMHAFKEQQDLVRKTAATLDRLLETKDFAEIDIASAQKSVDYRRSVVDELVEGNTELGELEKRLRELIPLRRRAQENETAISQEIGRYGAELEAAQQRRDEASRKLAELPIPPAHVAERLGIRFSSKERSIRGDNLDALERETLADLNSERDSIQRKASAATTHMIRQMDLFLAQWPEYKSDLVAETSYRADFTARLKHLEDDDLPSFQSEFRELLQEQTQTQLNRLLRVIQSAVIEVRRGIEPVNESLRAAEFNRGTYLQIKVQEARPAVAREFEEALREALGGVINDETAADDERRFHSHRRVIELMTVSDDNPERVRNQRLDTRLHVRFLGVEFSSEDGSEQNVYDSATGLSGGQAQKLGFFCLAAALRYQLTGAGRDTTRARQCVVDTPGGRAAKFGTVILDEAFDRADAEFTRQALDVVTQFGFHLVLATPEKMLQTIEDYIGGGVVVTCPDRRRSRIAIIPIDDDPDAEGPKGDGDEASR
ncbi:ATP-binding protein [Corynebacterium frankenforstense]